MSTKEDLKSQINSIAEKIARAKEIKGVLCLNNGKSNGGSFKTPPIDLALKKIRFHHKVLSQVSFNTYKLVTQAAELFPLENA